MAIDLAGIILPGDIAAEQYNHVDVFTQEYYTNQFPLISRVQRQTVDTLTFQIRHVKYRPQQFVLGVNMNGTDTYSVVTLTAQTPTSGTQTGDDSSLMAGDVLEFGAERVEVLATAYTEVAALPKLPTGQVIPAVGTVLVRRGAEGTTVAAHLTTDAQPTLIGNSRDGGEVFQTGIRAKPINVTQQCQTFQAPVQVGGSAQSSRIIGVPDLFAQVKQEQLTNMMRDMEKSSWYGIGETIAGANIRPKQIGARMQVTTNRLTASSPGAYLPANFIADALTPIYTLGGLPDFMFVAPNVLAGIDSWAAHVLRIDVGTNKFGTRIEAYQSSLAPGVTIIPAITLKPGTIFIGQSDLLFWRNKRSEFWQPRGYRGDAIEGEWIAEGAIEVRDQEKFAWVEGITAFATPP